MGTAPTPSQVNNKLLKAIALIESDLVIRFNILLTPNLYVIFRFKMNQRLTNCSRLGETCGDACLLARLTGLRRFSSQLNTLEATKVNSR